MKVVVNDVVESSKYVGKVLEYQVVKKDIFSQQELVSDEVWHSIIKPSVDLKVFKPGAYVEIKKEVVKYEDKDFWIISEAKKVK